MVRRTAAPGRPVTAAPVDWPRAGLARQRSPHFRLGLGMLVTVTLAIVGLLAVAGLNGAVVLYRTPTQAVSQHLFNRPLRIGGQIEQGSVYVVGKVTRFAITDGRTTIPVVYTGSLPGTFVPGQDALVGGELSSSRLFRANSLMVKHSDVYRAPNGQPYHPPKITAGASGTG